jgi:hypothetical protein
MTEKPAFQKKYYNNNAHTFFNCWVFRKFGKPICYVMEKI